MKELSVGGHRILGDRNGFNCTRYKKRTSFIEIENSEIRELHCKDSSHGMPLILQNLESILFSAFPSVDTIEGDEMDTFFSETSNGTYFQIAELAPEFQDTISSKRLKRSIVNDCPKSCTLVGNWTSLDDNDGTGDHEDFP